MAFDETGAGGDARAQARDLRARLSILVTEHVGFAPADIIFDPNIFAVATGIEEHNDYARAFIESAQAIKASWPHAMHVSGGVSNISFSFRGNNTVREAMHAVPLPRDRAGMDMGIVNAGQLAVYEDIPDALRDAVEDVLLNRRARRHRAAARDRRALPRRRHWRRARRGCGPAWREQDVDGGFVHALVHGIDRFIVEDTEEARLEAPTARST